MPNEFIPKTDDCVFCEEYQITERRCGLGKTELHTGDCKYFIEREAIKRKDDNFD